MAAANWSRYCRPHAAHGGEIARVGAHFEILGAQLGGHRGGEFAERLAMLDESVEVLGGIRIERRSQDAAVAQRARAEFHAAVHPGDDLVFVQLRHGGGDQFVVGQQVMEAQLAVLEHPLDLAGGDRPGREHSVSSATRRVLAESAVPGIQHRADGGAGIAGHRLHKNVARAEVVFERGDQQRVEAQAAGQAQVAALAPATRMAAVLDGLLDARRHVRAQSFGDRSRRPASPRRS